MKHMIYYNISVNLNILPTKKLLLQNQIYDLIKKIY